MAQGTFRDDRNWLAAGMAAAVTIPVLVFAAGLPYVLALGAGLVVFVGLVLILAPRQLFEGIDVSKVARGRVDLARRVLGNAMPAVDRLEAAAGHIASPRIKDRVGRLAATARAITAGVEENPDRLGSVQRFLTYYLPAASELAEGYAVLEEQRSPDPARLKQAEEVIAKLDEAFGHYADTLLELDLSGLDVELRLIESSLKEDLKERR